MDYSSLSDFEVNSAVHNALMDEPYKLEFLGNDKIRWVRGNTDVTTVRVDYNKNTFRDYCNNPADAWPIIESNGISIEFRRQFNLPPIAKGAHSQQWYDDKNPLRAAMTVFLMMQESANVQDNPAR